MKLSRYKHSSPVSYAFGATLCYEFLKTKPELITRLFLRPNNKSPQNTTQKDKNSIDLAKILALAKTQNIETLESKKAFNILGAKDNCFLIAEFKKITPELDPDKPHLVLVHPSDAGNVGTIIRSAAAFGYRNIAIIDPAVDHFVPKAVRASMGALLHQNIERFASFNDYLAKYPRSEKLAFMLSKNAKPAETYQLKSQNYALIFGNEASGLDQSYAQSCQPLILRQSPLVDSLNLSIAASVAMHHFPPEIEIASTPRS